MKKLALLLLVIGIIFCQIPNTMTYQGKLTDTEGIGINDSYTIEFKLYNVLTGGTELWSETHSSVIVDKGLFTVELGSITELDLPFDNEYWLEIIVDEDVMTPRQPLSSASYAFRAMIADSVDGGIIDDDWTITGDDIQLALAGNVGIGTAPSATTRLHAVTNETTGEKAVFGEYSSGGVSGWLGSSLYGAYGEFDSYNYGALGTSGIGILAAGETYAGRFEGDISVTNRFLDSGGDGGSMGQILSSTGTGTDWIDISGSGSSDPDFVLTTDIGDGTLDSVLVMEGKWGLFRDGNIGYGTACSTHVNLGVHCTTGTVGSNIKYVAILSGLGNRCSANKSVIGGGENNIISSAYGFIGGGNRNTVDSRYSSVVCGQYNSVVGKYSTIVGGYGNTVDGDSASILGGGGNTIYSDCAVILGGKNNSISDGRLSFIGGGNQNEIYGLQSSIVGGYRNTVNSDSSTILGGGGNTITSDASVSVILGGEGNSINFGKLSFIGNGRDNIISEYVSFIGSGIRNEISGNRSSIVGGVDNTVNGDSSSILGGGGNTISSDASVSVILGGESNRINDGSLSFIGNGRDNLISQYVSFIGSGIRNEIGGNRSSIVGGVDNIVNGDSSSILGGGGNTVNSDASVSVILGGEGNSISSGRLSFIGSGSENIITGNLNSITGGMLNEIDGQSSAIPGGCNNNVTGDYSFAFGNSVTVASDYTTSLYSEAYPGTFNIAGEVFIQNYSDIDSSNALLNIRNSCNDEGAYTGIRFKSHDNDAEENYKGGIFFDRTASFGRGDMLFALNNSQSVNNVNLDNYKMVITHDGNVGIDVREPGWLLEVNGNAAKPGGGSWTSSCDRRLKDIHADFDKGIDELLTLQPKYYNYKQDNPLGLPSDQTYIGLIAQDVQAVIPEAVSTNDKSDFLYLNNDAVIMAMLNGIKEHEQDINVQNAVISDLTQQVEDLRKENEELRKIVEKILNEK